MSVSSQAVPVVSEPFLYVKNVDSRPLPRIIRIRTSMRPLRTL